MAAQANAAVQREFLIKPPAALCLQVGKGGSKGNDGPAASSAGAPAGEAGTAVAGEEARDGDSDGDSEGLEAVNMPFCVLLSCLHNRRESHMVAGPAAGGDGGADPLLLMGPAGPVASGAGVGSDNDGDGPPDLVEIVCSVA